MSKPTFILIVILIFSACLRKNNKYENQNSEVLNLLIEKFQLNQNINIIIPLPWTPTDDDTFKIEDKTIIGKEINKKIEEHNSKINNSKTKLIIAIVDSTYEIDWNDVLEKFENHKIINEIIKENKTAKESRVIDINSFNINPNYELIKLSELKKKYEKNNEIKIPHRKFGALIGFSDIYFNEKLNYGFLFFMYSPLLFEGGQGYYVLIEKNNNHWKIKEFKLDWVV